MRTLPPIPFDREPVSNAPITELDMDLVFQTMQTGYNLGRFTLADVPGLTPELMRDDAMAMRYLDRFNGVTQVEHRMVPTVAGVLAFTHAPDKWIPEVFPDDLPLTLELLLSAQFARNPGLAMFLFHCG